MKSKVETAPLVKGFGLNELPEPFVDEASASVTYYGYAPLGTAEDEEGWVIVKKEKTGNVTKALYANGSMKFECAWSKRTSYNYSR